MDVYCVFARIQNEPDLRSICRSERIAKASLKEEQEMLQLDEEQLWIETWELK